MDFKGFKKISSDKNSTTFKHQNGSTLKIAHNALSGKMRSEMEKLPVHRAEGDPSGQVGGAEDMDDSSKSTPGVNININAAPPGGTQVPAAPMPNQAPMAPQPQRRVMADASGQQPNMAVPNEQNTEAPPSSQEQDIGGGYGPIPNPPVPDDDIGKEAADADMEAKIHAPDTYGHETGLPFVKKE